MAVCGDDDGVVGDGNQRFAGFGIVDPDESNDRDFKLPHRVAAELAVFARQYRRDLRGFSQPSSAVLAHTTIERLTRTFRQLNARFTVVSQNDQKAGDIALGWRDTVQGIAATEENKRTGLNVQANWL